MAKTFRSEQLLVILGQPAVVEPFEKTVSEKTTVFFVDRTDQGDLISSQGDLEKGPHWIMQWNCGEGLSDLQEDVCLAVSVDRSSQQPTHWQLLKLCHRHRDLV